MSIRRITVEFVGTDGVVQSRATGSVDRRIELIREARADLEEYRRVARHDGAAIVEHDYELVIRDAPDAAAWSPKR